MPKKGSKLTGLEQQLKSLTADLKEARNKKDTNGARLIRMRIRSTKADILAEQARLDKKQNEQQALLELGKAVVSAYGVEDATEALVALQAGKPFKK